MFELNIFLLWKPIIEITILWFVIYQIMLFFTGTRAINALRGVLLLLIAFFLFQRLNLNILDWLLTKLFGISVIALLIIFQPEIRRGLAQLGQRHIFASTLQEEDFDRMLKEISKAAEGLATQHLGALVAIERKDSLNSYIEGGVSIDAEISSDLIQAIFTPNNPLHDGGIIIKQGRVAAAGCLFPLADTQDLSRIFGTRHRAALGLSEENDAIIIIISEERGDISLVYRGKLYKDLSREDLVLNIKEIIKTEKKNE
jgi:diadenylate cyclase